MTHCPRALALTRLGVALLLASLLAAVWELLAQQGPSSPLYLDLLPGPIRSLRSLCFGLGLLVTLTGALLAPLGYGTRLPATIVGLFYMGAPLAVLAQLYGAVHGLHGVQLVDPRHDSLPLFALKHGGLLLCGLSFTRVALRVLRGPAR
jgi:hypothetical protein